MAAGSAEYKALKDGIDNVSVHMFGLIVMAKGLCMLTYRAIVLLWLPMENNAEVIYIYFQVVLLKCSHLRQKNMPLCLRIAKG